MPFTTFYGINTVVAETNIWIEDGSRLICMTYHYEPNSGHLEYAACIHRRTLSHLDYEGNKHFYDPTIDIMSGCEETTNRRFEIRPVIMESKPRMSYDEIITAIRREMCHGAGVKGPRVKPPKFETNDCESLTSGSDYLSDIAEVPEHRSDPYATIDAKLTPLWEVYVTRGSYTGLNFARYISEETIENYMGTKMPIVREYFMAFHNIVSKTHGPCIMFGATISRHPADEVLTEKEVDGHYRTAEDRKTRCPVAFTVPNDFYSEFQEQWTDEATHYEDVMYAILDKINSRPGGRFLIRGERCRHTVN